MARQRHPLGHFACPAATLSLALIGVTLLVSASAGQEAAPERPASPREVLQAQSAAWNRADIDGFMEHYWKSDQLTFSAGGKTTRGWQATKARYKQRYTTPEKMGRLEFDHLEFTPLGDAAALVLGQWHLKRANDNLGGNFSLVFRRLDARWVIIHDHTSSLDPPGAPAAD